MNEEFKKFKDTKYAISNLGNVYSEYTDKLLKPFPNNQGYLNVDVRVDGLKQYIPVHRMVAIAFIPNPENKPFVNHIDGNKQNNVVTNLEWVTAQENTLHAVASGLIKIGSEHHQSKLTEKEVHEIKNLMLLGERDVVLAERYNANTGVMFGIRAGRIWKHVMPGVELPLLEKARPSNIKISAEDIPVIRRLIAEGYNDAEIGRKYNVARGTINQIRAGRTWKNY